MGSAASAALVDYRYQRERIELRNQLMQQFEQDPQSHDVLHKIALVRKIITENADVCLTAQLELKNANDITITGIQAAYSELDRLLTIYETNTILKSVQCRIGPVACPQGHYSPYYDDFSCLIYGNKKVSCNICKKPCMDGHHCGYCFYSLCKPCSVIYCDRGHAMKLWTHPESQHSCIACKKQPVTSGYHCVTCEDYDICDACTGIAGRKVIQQVIHDRMAVDLDYIDKHQSESETALRTITSHKKKMQSETYIITLDLHNFSESLHQIKLVCVAEVRQTRITNAILKLRSVLVVGKEFSKNAHHESLQVENYTQEEVDRLEKLYHCHEYLKSVVLRCKTIVACPLGHACSEYDGLPAQYQARLPDPVAPSCPYRPPITSKKNKNLVLSQKPLNVYCRVCDLIALKGYHCDYCEYDLCLNCTNMYCAEGHVMTMWTEPSSLEKCFLCQAEPIGAGYRCTTCQVDLCDMCTTKANREKIRTNWEAEMEELLTFMKENKHASDIALYYNWRHQNHIAAMGRLVDYVHELRTAKQRALLQIHQKPIIDKIKLLRQEVCQHGDLCASAAREIARNEVFVFPTAEKAMEELLRLSVMLREMIMSKDSERRLRAGVACPLGHAMVPIVLDPTIIDENNMAVEPVTDLTLVLSTADTSKHNNNSNYSNPPSSSKYSIAGDQSASIDSVRLASLKDVKQQLLSRIQDTMNSVLSTHYDPMHGPKRMCKICSTEKLLSGHTCPICEYDLCVDCSVIFCREGHVCKIWTMPDAASLSCDICKASSITSGYRCLTCNTDICDLCTTQDSRNAFALWPRREFHRVKRLLENMRAESIIARNYLDELHSGDQSYLEAMSKLCIKLKEIQTVKVHADEEVKTKITTKKAKSYGFKAKDMI